MLPIGFIEEFGIGAAELLKTTRLAVPLQELLDIARSASTGGGIFFKFAADVRKALPSLSWEEISMYYKSARFWSAQRVGIQMYDPDVVIDPALAQTATRKLADFDPSTRYRYDVEVTYENPVTGERTTIYRSINSERPLSGQEAIDALHARMVLSELDIYEPILADLESDPGSVDMRVTGFYRYSYEG
jgi:hypothetical protein